MGPNGFKTRHRVFDFEDKGVNPGDSVSLDIYSRRPKGIHSHLRNITTSVANPVDRIGYVAGKGEPSMYFSSIF